MTPIIPIINMLLLGLGLVTTLYLIVILCVYFKEGLEAFEEFKHVYTNIIVWVVTWAGFYYFTVTQNVQKEIPPYDYIIDLHPDYIDVYTDDGRTLEIHPDSLQVFIELDNL